MTRLVRFSFSGEVTLSIDEVFPDGFPDTVADEHEVTALVVAKHVTGCTAGISDLLTDWCLAEEVEVTVEVVEGGETSSTLVEW